MSRTDQRESRTRPPVKRPGDRLTGSIVVFLHRKMPELTGRSLEQIEDHLEKGRFKPADFASR